MANPAEGRSEVTQLLIDWRQGDQQALERLTPLIYNELRRLAAGYLARERAAATLQPTALVAEAYIRLVGQELPEFRSRSHFFGVAAHLMRQVLVDHARKFRSQKRGGGQAKVSIDEALSFSPDRGGDIIALNDALDALAKIDERKCKVIEMRFFGGLSVEETAEALGISVATVGREQRVAEAWLYKEMRREEEGAQAGGA
ncbi:MAG: sigma-70 family RNA polymerase sigma factor [Bryobacterales bacterium]|nr:sigma-70 family RNA polymerase sigma factor [Bryobacterales bacterium]